MMDLEVAFQLGVDLGDKLDANTKVHRDALDSVVLTQPIRRDFHGAISTGATPANPILLPVFDISVAAGRMWEITDVGVFGPDGHTQVQTTTGVIQVVPAATTVNSYNGNPYGVYVTTSGATGVTAVNVNGSLAGTANGTYYVPAGGSISVTYSGGVLAYSTASASACYADIYCGPDAGMDFPGDFASFILSSNIPTLNGLIGDHKAYGMMHDHLYAWVYNAPANTQLSMAGTILDWPIWVRNAMVQ